MVRQHLTFALLEHGGMCIVGRTEIVETLLDAGMDPNCFDGVSGEIGGVECEV